MQPSVLSQRVRLGWSALFSLLPLGQGVCVCVCPLLQPMSVNCVFNAQSSQETVKLLVILTQLQNFRCSRSCVELKAELKLLLADNLPKPACTFKKACCIKPVSAISTFNMPLCDCTYVVCPYKKWPFFFLDGFAFNVIFGAQHLKII